ncbi:MAG: transglycosylase SLT domain-containing protein [Proteobacteria bacterium]|nr:transglycosylase SLT domain-containing protein [Pseudomonadota bacterium]
MLLRCAPQVLFLLLASVTATASGYQGDADERQPPATSANTGAPELLNPSPDVLLRSIQQAVVRLGVAPAALSSDAPDGSVPAPTKPLRLGWVRGLARPDLPARWDDRVIQYLYHFRHDARGRLNVRSWLKRAQRYSSMIRRVMREHGLPEDLMYVAMVESGFEPLARSAAGAVGMWQFMAPTAREYGLRKDRWVDQRLDPERATEAAARYLAELHARVGSWELALAAYNMGYSALHRAIRKYNSNDFWLLTRMEAGLPVESAAYVAKVVACAIVGRNRKAFGVDAVRPASIPRLAIVEVPGGRSLAPLARAAGMDLTALLRLNRELVRGRIPPEARTYALRIPADRVARFRKARARRGPHTASHATHVMRFGESLADVAYRYRTSQGALRKLNGLEEVDRIGPGFTLLVPDVKPRAAKSRERPIAAVPAQQFRYPNRRHVFYQVQSGDRCERIASFFGVTVDELLRWNAIDPSAALHKGMVIQLFVPRSVDLGLAVVHEPSKVIRMVLGSDEFFDYHEAQRGRVRMRYLVKEGDTFGAVARRFDLSPGSLARINRMSRRTKLETNQELIVYLPKELASQLAVAKRDQRESATTSEKVASTAKAVRR